MLATQVQENNSPDVSYNVARNDPGDGGLSNVVGRSNLNTTFCNGTSALTDNASYAIQDHGTTAYGSSQSSFAAKPVRDH
eukprot:12419352-Karenia_brevis.AAC.1